MTYLFDSDWVIDWLDGRRAAVSLLNRLVPAGSAISIITFAEVYEGIYYGRDAARTEAAFRLFLRGVTVLGVTRTIARRYARLRGSLRAQGPLIPQPDILHRRDSAYPRSGPGDAQSARFSADTRFATVRVSA